MITSKEAKAGNELGKSNYLTSFFVKYIVYEWYSVNTFERTI